MAKRRKPRQAVARKSQPVSPAAQQAAERAQARATERSTRKTAAQESRRSRGISFPTFAIGALIAVILVGGFLYFNRNDDDGGDTTPTATTVASIGSGTGTPEVAGPTPYPVADGMPLVDGKPCWNTPATFDANGKLQWSVGPNLVIDTTRKYSVTINTTAGDVTVELDPTVAPMAVNNFVCLAASGYYSNVPFHRIMTGFMIQSGDPTGTGSGGPGYSFPDELPAQGTTPYVRGTLAMANSGPNTNGSQFFIMHADNVGMPVSYAVFGHVTDGMDVVDALASTPVESNGIDSVPSKPTITVLINTIRLNDLVVGPLPVVNTSPVSTPVATPLAPLATPAASLSN